MKRLLKHRYLVGGLVLVVTLLAASWFARPQMEEDFVPVPDVTYAHPKVVSELKRLQRQVREDPASAASWGELGQVLMAHGWNAEAASAFERAAQLDQEEVRWPYLRAMLLESTDLRQAADVYARASTIDPNYAALRYRWAQVLIRLDQPAAAEEQLGVAAQLAPQSPQPRLALGRAALARQDLAAARDCFRQATSVAPLCREAREQLARVNFLLADRPQAERDQQLAGSLPPSYPPLADPFLQEVQQRELVARQSAEQADRLAASGDMAAAQAAFEKLIDDRPDLSRPRLNLAALLAMQGDMRGAAALYGEIIARFPSEALGYQGLGGVKEVTGDVDGAIAAYRQCVRLKPDYAQAHHALGLLWERKRNQDEAITAYRAAITADARFAPAHLALGLALQKQGHLDAAVQAIENAVRLAPNDAVPRGYLQRARQAQQRAAESRQAAGPENESQDAHDQP